MRIVLEIMMNNKLWRLFIPILVVALFSIGSCSISACASIGATPSRNEMRRFQRSPNYKTTKFKNTMAVRESPFFKTVRAYLRGAENTKPKEPVPTAKQTRQHLSVPPQNGLRITWMGHSTTLIEMDETRLLIDPVWSDHVSPVSTLGPKRFHSPPLCLRDLPPIDAVLISHDHYDHLDMKTAIHLGAKGTKFVVPLGVGARLKSWSIPDSQIVELDWWQQVSLGDVTVTATPARHFSGRSLVMADRDKTLWVGFAIADSDHRVFYTGDTGMFPGFVEIGKRLGPFDAVLAEIGAYDTLWSDIHLGPEQAVQATKDAKGKLLIPVHWGTFDLALHSWTEPVERVFVAAAKQSVSLAIPMPGQSVDPAHPPGLAKWWPKLPWRTARDYPVVSSKLAGHINTDRKEK